MVCKICTPAQTRRRKRKFKSLRLSATVLLAPPIFFYLAELSFNLASSSNNDFSLTQGPKYVVWATIGGILGHTVKTMSGERPSFGMFRDPPRKEDHASLCGALIASNLAVLLSSNGLIDALLAKGKDQQLVDVNLNFAGQFTIAILTGFLGAELISKAAKRFERGK